MPIPNALFVLNSLGIGGSETKIIRVANKLAQSGVEVQLAYLNCPETAMGRINDAISVTNLKRNGKYSLFALRRLLKLKYQENQVVISVNLYPLLYVVPAAWWYRARHVQAIGLVNTAELVGSEERFGAIYGPLLKRCDRVIFGCVAQRDLWVDKYGLSLEKSQVIYNGVDSDFYCPMPEIEPKETVRIRLGIPIDGIVIGSVGRLDPEKSFDLLLTALARLNAFGREAYAILVGQGKERERLEALARNLGVEDRVKFLGLLHDVRPAIACMDIFVLPSSAVETFSNAALEAMAMGRAVVLSRMGGAEEMVEHGKSGMLFPVGDGDTLTEILVTLSDCRELREALGMAARARVEASFGFPHMVDQYRRLLTRA